MYSDLMRPELRIGQSYLITPEHPAGEHIGSTTDPHCSAALLQERPEWNGPYAVLMPLHGTRDRLLGVLTASGFSGPTAPDRGGLEILEIIANQAAVAIENTRLYQALHDAYEAKGEFLSLVGRELQVPMGTLWGYAEFLDEEMENIDLSALRGFVQVLKANIGRLDALVHDMLEVSRAEAGALQLEPAALDVSEVILDSVANVRPQAERKGLALAVDLPPGLPPVVADRGRLGEVLDNLLTNALKYTPPPGNIEVSARVMRRVEDLNGSGPVQPRLRCPCLVISVADSGIGMSHQDQRRVFARFFRAEHPVVRQEMGTGLGLYLVQLLVESQGGQVWMESKPEQGSRFFVGLPMAEG